MLKVWQKAASRKRRKAPLRLALRNSAGIYMVELLVSIVIGTMILFTLTSMLGTTLRLGSKSQNEVYAQETLSELMEFTRGVGYAYLDSRRGTHVLLANKILESEVGPNVRTSPVQLDFVSQTWSPSTKTNRFNGTVTYKVELGPEANTLKVTISLGWQDSTSFNTSSETGQGRTVSASTIITKDGSDKYVSEDMLP